MTENISCSEAVSKLWELIDQELDEASCENVRAHLERCRYCFPHYEFQQAYRDFMSSCKDGTCASPELRRRIFASLVAEKGGT